MGENRRGFLPGRVRAYGHRVGVGARDARRLGMSPPPRSRSPLPASANYPNQSPAEPTGPGYSARVALSCQREHAPGEVLHALHELRSDVEERLRSVLGARYDRHTAQSAGTDKLIVTFICGPPVTRTRSHRPG